MTEIALTGSTKQIAWANKIRAEVLADIAQQRIGLQRVLAAVDERGTPEQIQLWHNARAAAEAAFEAVEAQSSAPWWIDNAQRLGRGIATRFLVVDDPQTKSIATTLIEGKPRV